MHRKGEMYRNVHDELLQRRSFVVELAEFGADTNWSLAVGQKLEKLTKTKFHAGGHWFKNENGNQSVPVVH